MFSLGFGQVPVTRKWMLVGRIQVYYSRPALKKIEQYLLQGLSFWSRESKSLCGGKEAIRLQTWWGLLVSSVLTTIDLDLLCLVMKNDTRMAVFKKNKKGCGKRIPNPMPAWTTRQVIFQNQMQKVRWGVAQ